MASLNIRTQRFMTLCLALTMLAGSALLFPGQAKAAMNDADSVMSVVYTFYKKYSVESIPSVSDCLREQPEVDAAFVEQVTRRYKEAEKEEYGPPDLVLMAQDTPFFMQYSRPIINSAKANIIAYGVWRGSSTYPICVSLLKKEGDWRISAVHAMDVSVEFGGVLECGGMPPDR